MPILAVGLTVLVPVVWLLGDGLIPGIGPGVALLAALALIKELWPSRKGVDAWAIGAQGEEQTARTLTWLGADYAVFHDRRIPGSRANIDHIVVGPTGVFVIETKNIAGRVTVRGGELFVSGRRRQEFVDQAWRQAAAVQAQLSDMVSRLGVDVRPLIACIGRSCPGPGPRSEASLSSIRGGCSGPCTEGGVGSLASRSRRSQL